MHPSVCLGKKLQCVISVYFIVYIVTYQDKCEEISVRLQIPRRRDPNVIDATLKIKLRKQVIIFCSCIRPTSTLVTTDPIWLKGEEALTQTNSGRIRFYYLPRTKVAVLHITNFQLSDIGTYTCEDYQLRESLQIVPPSDDSSSGIIKLSLYCIADVFLY